MNRSSPMPGGAGSEGQRSAAGASGEQSRREAVSAVISDVLARRSRGEIIPDSDVVKAHASLRPELEAELRAMREMHQIFLSARRAGPLVPSPSAGAETDIGVPPRDAADASQHVGAVAIQSYTILQEISSGGQGTVFRAIHDPTGRSVAIKVIPGGLLTGSRHRARFEREATILARLDHPNIVGILDRGRTADGSLFLAMPFIDGRTLEDYLQQLTLEGRLDLRELLRVFVQISHAVAEAHRQGIVHRDLKPANIRVDQRGQPHILDFGLARLRGDGGTDRLSSITMTGQIVGSLPWTSPEQVSHDPDAVDARTDVYSLGVMLYQGLTDSFPYPVLGSVREVLDNIAHAVPVPPSHRKTAASRAADGRLDSIVLRALAKSPADRYASARDLAEDIERYLEGRPLARATKAAPGRYRRRWPVLAGVILCLCGLAGAILWTSKGRPRVDVVKLETITNSIGMHLVRIPPGESRLGSDYRAEPMARKHWAQFDIAFFMGTTEVTQKQYLAIMGELPAKQVDEGDDLPVGSVTWGQAMEFCRRLGEREHRPYRLPREDEWEYACRAGSGGDFSGTGDVETMGWYKHNSDAHIHPVAKKLPNNWGLYDMHGNVSEWCAEAAIPGISPEKARRNPGVAMIARGGGASSRDVECRSAAQSFVLRETSRFDLGFRVVADP